MNIETFVTIGLPVSLALIMLGMGLTLSPQDFLGVVRRPRPFLVGLIAQLLAVPLLAILLLQIKNLPVDLAIGLLILSFCPGGTTSNLFSYLARADVPLSIALTAAASLITPLSIPLFTEFTLHFLLGESREISIPISLTATRLFVVTVIPLILGMTLKQIRPTKAKCVHQWVHKVSMILFFSVIVCMVFSLQADLPQYLGDIASITLLMIIMAMLTGYLFARFFQLNRQERKTISIEVGMQNGGMALIVTQGILHNEAMSVVPIVYGILMLLPIGLYILMSRYENT